MKNALLVHGAYGNTEENWIPWLKRKLEDSDFLVTVPILPTPENQNLDNWLNIISPYLTGLGEESILVGHSIGAVFLLSILEKLEMPIRNAIFVSGFLHNLGNKKFDEINKSFYAKDFDWLRIRNNAKNIVVFHGSNDPYVPVKEAEILANALEAKIKIIEGGGHLNESAGFKEFPELLEAALK